jgi:hypothetical protein
MHGHRHSGHHWSGDARLRRLKLEIAPFVPLELGGKARRLVFDFNAQAAFEEIAGITVLSLFDKQGRLKISSRYTRALLWSQLLHFDEKVQFDEFGRITEHPELSMQQVGSLISRDNLKEVNTSTAEALLLFFKPAKPKTEGTAEEKNPPVR